MQEPLNTRPHLTSLRVQSFHGDNLAEADGALWKLELQQDIQMALAVPKVSGAGLQAVVKIELTAQAKSEQGHAQPASFKGLYEAKFNYVLEVTEVSVAQLMEQEPYQYMLVAQAYPLAMTHFRRELQAMGFDARNLPLGLTTQGEIDNAPQKSLNLTSSPP